MIHAVLFDLFETLVTESNTSVTRAGSLASRLGVNEARYRPQWRSRRPDVVLGRCSFADALAHAVRASGGVPDLRLLERLRSERMSEKAAVLRTVDPRVRAAVDGLRARGFKLAVVSNCFAEDVAGWDDSPLRDSFNATIFSCAAGFAKPDAETYRLACRELQVSPGRALFIGDGADDELAGARAAGLSACRAVFPFLPVAAGRMPQ